MKYTCILFDLDHTLWDYETNSRETLAELYESHSLQQRGVPDFETFNSRFKEINTQLWDLYDRNQIDRNVIRTERFKKILEPFGAHEPKFSEKLSDEYLDLCPQKGHAMPNAASTLDYLSKQYKLVIVTNGFEEIQHIKLASAKLDHFFEHIVTSQKAGCKKPDAGIFTYALSRYTTLPHEAVMVGDNLIADMQGARKVNIDNVFFNPEGIVHTSEVKHEIKDLKELCTFL